MRCTAVLTNSLKCVFVGLQNDMPCLHLNSPARCQNLLQQEQKTIFLEFWAIQSGFKFSQWEFATIAGIILKTHAT